MGVERDVILSYLLDDGIHDSISGQMIIQTNFKLSFAPTPLI